VQTLILLTSPFTNALTRWMFGFQVRFVFKWEWLTLKPLVSPLAQISHTFAIYSTSFDEGQNPKYNNITILTQIANNVQEKRINIISNPYEGIFFSNIEYSITTIWGGDNMINKNTPIIVALRSHPDAREIFMKHGMGCIGCMGSTSETIENGAKMHGIDVESLVKELNSLRFKE